MNTIADYLRFKRFIMPAALQFFFWSAIGGTLYGTWWLFTHDNWAWIMSLVFGTLTSRLLVESLLIKYQTYVLLKRINEKLNEKD